jgi:hypothetical protein
MGVVEDAGWIERGEDKKGAVLSVRYTRSDLE